MGVDIDDLGVPVSFFAGNIIAALQNEDPFAGGSEMIGERSSASARSRAEERIAVSNDNRYDVIIIGTGAGGLSRYLWIEIGPVPKNLVA